MIMSIIYPDEGVVDVLGGTALASKDRIGYLPEERGVYRKMRVGDFLRYIARLKGVDGPAADRRVREWLDRIELPDAARKKCEELSKGMQQKVQFLASIIHDPDLIILDEPFSGLDPVNADLLKGLIQELNEAGKTIIFSTHVLHQAEKICERFFLINQGQKLLDATLEEIRQEFSPRTIIAEPLNGTAAFDRVSGVHHARRLSEADSAAWELDLAEGADPQAVMRDLMDSAPMRSVHLRRMTMEEVFITLVRQDVDAIEEARLRKEFKLG